MLDDPVYVVGLVNSCVVCMRHRCFSSSQMAAVSDGRRQTERDSKCDFLGLNLNTSGSFHVAGFRMPLKTTCLKAQCVAF